VLELPLDRTRPIVQSHRGAQLPFTISKGLTAQINELSRREGVTLFMTLLTAFEVMLFLYTRHPQIVVGTPIANRRHSETEALIGFFVNTLALRMSLASQSWLELLLQVKKVALDAYANQDVPFEKLVEDLRPEREMSHHPIVQVMMVLQNAPKEELELSGLTLVSIDTKTSTAKFDLTLSMWEAKDQLHGSIEYCPDLFDAETIERMAGHYQVLIAALVAEPSKRIDELDMLSQQERHQLLLEWNHIGRRYSQDQCLQDLFGVHAARSPETVAVVFGQEQISYGELDCRASQLANHLQCMGVGPEELVGLCLEPSVEMIVGLLGILKAGAAYLPVDPSIPAVRQSFILADATVRVLLTRESLRASFPSSALNLISHTLQVISQLPGKSSVERQIRECRLCDLYVWFDRTTKGRHGRTSAGRTIVWGDAGAVQLYGGRHLDPVSLSRV